jgi:hypothetical protein
MRTKSKTIPAKFAQEVKFNVKPETSARQQRQAPLLESLVLRRTIPALPDKWQSRGVAFSALND